MNIGLWMTFWPWLLKTLGALEFGTFGLWDHMTLGLRFFWTILGTMDFCTIGIWGHGTLEPGDFGTLGPLDCGKVKDRSGLSTCHGSGRRCRVRSHYLSPMGLHEQGVYLPTMRLLYHLTTFWPLMASLGWDLSVTRSKLRSKRSKPAICRS